MLMHEETCMMPIFMQEYLSHIVTKPAKWHVHLAKTQITLGMSPVWSDSSLSAGRKLGSLATYYSHFVGFVMSRLICFQIELMKETVERSLEVEEKKNGLVIVKALYGKLVADNEE